MLDGRNSNARKQRENSTISLPSRGRLVDAPSYLAERPARNTPQELIVHVCIDLRLPAHGGLFARESQNCERDLRVRVDGQLGCNAHAQIVNPALAGFGLAYRFEDRATAPLRRGRLQRLLRKWCPPLAGSRLYYASRRPSSPAFALLADALRIRD